MPGHDDASPQSAEDLEQFLARRVRACMESQMEDAAQVLGQDVEQQARALWQRVGSGEAHDAPSLKAMTTLGWFHFLRFHLLPEGSDRGDLQASAVFFTFVRDLDPKQLPPQMEELLSDGPFVMITDDQRKMAVSSDSYVALNYPGLVESVMS